METGLLSVQMLLHPCRSMFETVRWPLPTIQK